MEISKNFFWAMIPFVVSACGAERDSSSSVSVSTSSSASSAYSTEVKSLKINFDEAGCLMEHNADAVTEFDAFGGQRKLLAWGCVSDTANFLYSQKLNLVYVYDQASGCYKKREGENLFYGALSTKVNSNCTSVEHTISKPVYAAEVLVFDVITKSVTDSGVVFSFNYSWKNTGTLPLSQYKMRIKVEYVDGQMAGQFVYWQYLGQSYVFPDGVISSSETQISNNYTFDNFKANQLYNVSFSILDFYGETIASASRQVTGI